MAIGVSLCSCVGNSDKAPPAPVNVAAKNTSPAVPPSVQASSLDAALKNDAFYNYGIGSSNPSKEYSITLSGRTSTQKQTLRIESADNKSALVTEQDTGGPEGDLTQRMTLKPDGLYVDSIEPQTLETPHFLEMPGILKVGTTWKNRQKLVSRDTTLDQTISYRVADRVNVKTAAGTFDTLHVLGVGHGTLASAPADIKIESWYSKEMGLVKQVATIKSKAGSSTIVQELAKGT